MITTDRLKETKALGSPQRDVLNVLLLVGFFAAKERRQSELQFTPRKTRDGHFTKRQQRGGSKPSGNARRDGSKPRVMRPRALPRSRYAECAPS